MGSSRQTPPGQFQTAQTGPQMGPPTPNGQHPQSPFAPGGAMDPMRPAAPSWNPAAQTQANLRGNQRTRAELEALRYPNGRPGAVPPPPVTQPGGQISNPPGYMPPELQPMAPQAPTQGTAQDPGSIGQPAPPIQNNAPSVSAVMPSMLAPQTQHSTPVPSTAGPVNRGPISTTMPIAPTLSPINQNAGPGGKGGTANAPQYSHLTGLLGGRGG